jgi:ribonuclease E
LIVIDFIDMRDRKHKAEVEKALKTALKADKARVSVDKISQFGLLEMSRQRIKQTINEGSYLECPHCGGHGKVKSVEAMALSSLRKVHTAAARGTLAEVRGGLPLEVAYYLLNRNKRELAQIETDYDIEVTVKGKPSFMMNQMELDLFKKEKQVQHGAEHELAPEAGYQRVSETEMAASAASPDESLKQPLPGEGEETKSKRKRRRGKKKPPATEETPSAEEAASPVETAEPAELEQYAFAQEESLESVPSVELSETESPVEAVKKKRRRRRKRTPKPDSVAETGSEALEAPEVLEASEPSEEEQPAIVVPEETALPETPEQQEEAPKKKPRKPRAPRKPKAVAAEETTAGPAPLPAEVAPPVTEAHAGTIVTETEPATEKSATAISTVAEEAAEKPKRKRAPRKKKEPVPEEPEQNE